jgi:rod shape-determining protein MreD
MGLLVLFALGILGCALPDMAPRALGLAAYPPDLFVAAAAYLGLRGKGGGAIFGAVLLGFLRDAASLDPVGTHASVLGVVAFVFLSPDRARPPVGAARAIAVVGACLLARVLLEGRGLLLAPEGPGLGALPGSIPAGLLTALVAWPLFALLDRTRVLDDWTGTPRGLPS